MKEQIEAVQRMQDYIEKNLDDKITPAKLAQAAMFSPWYSQRLFKRLTGYAVVDYIRRLRLSKSALRLRDEGQRVLDAALDAGFESAEGYQRAFFREFGCNPGEYAKNPVPLYLFIPYGVKYRELIKEERKMGKTDKIFLTVEQKPARKVIIKRGIKATNYFEYCDEVGCEIWGLLTSMCRADSEPVCLWLPERYIKQGTSQYVQGVEVDVDYSGTVPEDMDVIKLPASKYLVFRGEPFNEEDYIEVITSIQEAVENYDISLLGYERDMTQPRIQLEPRGERGYIEMVGIK